VADPGQLPPGRDLRLIGVAAVSLSPNGRDTHGFPMPHQRYQDGKRPLDDAAYISSMAVDKNFRRQGVASALLKAAEVCVEQAGLTGMYLTALQRDEAAQQLYLRAGFEVLSRQQPGPIAFLNIHRQALKVLMARKIAQLSNDTQTQQ
jgi:ribosomal protein S18 acetylase RimI-like enzyme